jgi:tyrosine-protein kinase Etk/Wzc
VKQIRPTEQDTNIELYKNLIKKLINKWYFFVLSLVISMGMGYYFVKSSNPKFQNNLLLLIQESGSSRNPQQGDLAQLQMFTLQSELEDELGIISSFPVIFETVKKLDLGVSYYIGEGLIRPEIYKSSPIEVNFDIDKPQPVNVMFELNKITKDGCNLKVTSEGRTYLYDFLSDTVFSYVNDISLTIKYKFGDEVDLGVSKFKIFLNSNFDGDAYSDKKLYFKFNDIVQLTYHFQNSLKVERISIQSSLVSVSLKWGNSSLVTDFLNTLATVYLNRNLQKKNIIADKTISFIDRQISGIADSLGLTADQLKDFRVKNQVMDINYLSQSVYQQMQILEDQRAELMVASKYYDYIKEYFENNKNLTDLLAPSAMGVNDPQLQNLIVQLTEKNAQRSLQLDSKSEKNPMLPILNAEINNLKKTILENIDYIVNTSNITINDINNRIALLKGQVRTLPGIEKELKNIEREFHVNDAIYTFLLSTRAEAEIARASNSPDYEVIDPAKLSSARMVSPKRKIDLHGCIFYGYYDTNWSNHANFCV